MPRTLDAVLGADGAPDAAFAAVAGATEAGHGPSAVVTAQIAGRPWEQERHAQALRWLSAARASRSAHTRRRGRPGARGKGGTTDGFESMYDRACSGGHVFMGMSFGS